MEKNNNNEEDILNSLLKTKFIDLNNVDTREISQLKTEDIIRESQKLVNKAVKNKTIKEYEPNKELKEKGLTTNKEESKQGLKIDTSIESNDDENEIPSKYLSNPLDFVNYIEYLLPQEKSNLKKNTFILKKYKNENKIKHPVCELNPQEDLSSLMMTGEADITSAIVHEDNIITGDILGDIKFYSLKDKKCTRTLSCPIKKRVQINAIDLSDEGDYLFAGFGNGNITLYELAHNKCKLKNDNIHKTACINLKYMERLEKKSFKLFTSDEEGNVFEIIIKDNLFGFYIPSIRLCYKNKELPTFLMEILKFKENEINYKNYLKNINKTLILGNLEKINLYNIQSKTAKIIFTFDKPSYINDYSIPDIAFGLGKEPKSSEINEKNDELQILLLISWEKILYLYTVPIINDELTSPLLSGYYVNDNQIIRIGFLSISTIYLIDKKNNFKILNTRKFNLGKVEFKKDLPIPIIPETNSNAELQESLKFEENILKQIYLKTPNGSIKETYLFSIINNLTKYELNVLTKKTIYSQQLSDYQKFLKELQKKEKWMDLLIIGINIYQGEMTALNGIPIKEDERKRIIGEYLQDLISQFLFINAGSQQILNNNKNNFFDPSLENSRIEKNMEIVIEFCIEIDSIDYLLDKILKIYESKKYKDIFLSKLEPFILCNKIVKFEIPEEILLDIIKLYEAKKNFDTLNKLLLHINVNSLEMPLVKQKLENLLLTTPLIYIYVNGKSQDYFKPVLHIYEKYLSATEIPNFVSYEDLITSKKLFVKQIKSSKQYIGHQLFWYILKSLTGKKFPYYNENMDRDMYHKAIGKTIYWLLSDEVLNDLIFFETKSFFEIFTFILSNEELIEVLEDNNEDEDKKREAFEILKKKENSAYTFIDINPIDLANHLIGESNKLGNKSPIIFLYLCIFIVNVSKTMNLKKDDKKEAVKFIIENYHKFKKINLDLPTITRNIIDSIDDLQFSSNDYNEILAAIKTHIFDEVKLFILKKNGNYKQCLELYLNKDSELLDKRESLFPFINMTLTKLKIKKGKDKEVFDDFKKAVMNNIVRIAEINLDELNNLINLWYSKEKKDVINKLNDKPEIQLKYIEKLIRKINNTLKDNEGILVDEDPDWVDSLLKLHIKLLCILNKKDEILPCLKECPLYPIKESIDLCKKYQAYDALIYLYKKAGYIDKALDICLKLIQNNYETILANLKSKEFNENLHDLKIMDFNSIYNDAVDILEENEKALSDDHNMWFTLLDNIYKYVENFPKQKKNIPNAREKFGEEVGKLLSDKHIQLLEKMSTYVGVNKILDIICEKNKKAEFREFKPLLLKMLASFGSQTHLLKSIRTFLIHDCIDEHNILKNINAKGKDLDFSDDCEVCQKNFNQTLKDKEKVVVFKCNHIEHENCSFKGDDKYGSNRICPICLKKEIEDSVTCGPDIPNKNLSLIELMNKDNQNLDSSSGKITNANLSNYNKGFIKMRAIDNYDKEKRNMFYYDSATSCRNKYRKKVFDDY